MPRVLWREERERFLAALNAPDRHLVRNRALLLVAYDTGCRVSELVALDVADYDPQRRSLHLTNIKAAGHPRREVPLHPRVNRALRAWLRARPVAVDDALFVSQQCRRLSVRQVSNIYNKICERAGIDGHGIHTLRHTMATRLLDDHTLDVHQVSRRLGHREIATTYRFYVHGDVEAEADQIRRSRL